jgi:polyisoprenoid-binding protein YceI
MRAPSLVATACLAIGSLALPAPAAAAPVVYNVDTGHSAVSFTIRHFVTNVPGRFGDFDGKIVHDPDNPAASRVELNVRAASIDTDNADRDKHLRSADFFDAEKFPALTFVSTGVKKVDADTMEVTGDLSIHGVTKRVTIPVDFLGTVKTSRGEKAGFETAFTVNRKDYGIIWNRALDAGGAMLGDDVKVVIAIEANREAAPAAEAPKPGR